MRGRSSKREKTKSSNARTSKVIRVIENFKLVATPATRKERSFTLTVLVPFPSLSHSSFSLQSSQSLFLFLIPSSTPLFSHSMSPSPHSVIPLLSYSTSFSPPLPLSSAAFHPSLYSVSPPFFTPFHHLLSFLFFIPLLTHSLTPLSLVSLILSLIHFHSPWSFPFLGPCLPPLHSLTPSLSWESRELIRASRRCENFDSWQVDEVCIVRKLILTINDF